MRFVRAFVRGDTGEIIAVGESETPIENMGVSKLVPIDGGPEIPVLMREIGLAEDFDPVDLEGKPCSPARHIFLRIEQDGAGGQRAKAGQELPPILDCPTSMDGIRARVSERGAAGVPVKARAWLTLMLPPEEVDALGVSQGIPLSALKALDAMRVRRDPRVGSRREVLEREAQRLSDERAAAQLRRQPEEP
jgi:hypothetical protein